jgi:DNA-directed RNA polymerase subunit RPC12/RpoP
MFARVTCPACQYALSIPEGEMGKRYTCPNCQSPFFAGKTAGEAVSPAAFSAAPLSSAGPAGGYAKTLLGEMAPPIKYNCPRCKAPLEAAASEAGTKKPCPSCGQRLQVPAAPPPAPAAAGQPNLNKTLLASDESQAAPPIKYNCPNCKKPLEAPAGEAGTKKNCPSCGQRLQVPAAPAGSPTLNKTMLASDEGRASPAGAAAYAARAAGAPAPAAPGPHFVGPVPLTPRNVAIAAGVLLLLLFVVPAILRGGKVEDTTALAKAQQELEKAKAEIEQRKKELELQKQAAADTHRQLEEMAAKMRAQDEKMLDTLRRISDQKQKDELEAKWQQEKREMERNQQKLLEEAKARLDESKRALDAAQQAQQRQQTIIQQPPVIYYPPYSPRYYWPW